VEFAITTGFEALSPVELLSKRFRLGWLAVISPSHLVILLTMSILFWENLLPI